jgi:Eukaryotic aspartyl protease
MVCKLSAFSPQNDELGDSQSHLTKITSVSSLLQHIRSLSWQMLLICSANRWVKCANSQDRSIQYGDNSEASGKVCTDTVTIGGTTVTNQAVELANKVSRGLQSDGADGFVGLAFGSINTVTPQKQSTFFENAQATLKSPLFAAYLPHKADGAYHFGYTDSSKYTGNIVYTDVQSDHGFWEYPSTSYKVGSTTYTQPGFTALSDTGTTLLLMSDSAVMNYYSQVPGASIDASRGGYTFPCSSTLPTLSIAIGSGYATIPSSLLNYDGSTSTGNCFGSLQSIGNGTQAILGDVFFNANYAVFDASGPRFGYAPAK